MSLGRHWLLYGVQRLVPVALVLAMGAPVQADEPAVHPIFVTADVGLAGSWTGYRASVQVRPLTFAVWPGGYLTDGTFVQNGFIKNGDDLYVFAWATTDTSNGDFGVVPLTLRKVDPKPGSWVTFELAWACGRWTFRYQDATGWHAQGSWRSTARLSAFLVANEYWATTAAPFGTQAVRHVKVRASGVWATPKEMAFSATDERCGHDSITSSVPGSLVFRSVEGPCRMYRRLW